MKRWYITASGGSSGPAGRGPESISIDRFWVASGGWSDVDNGGMGMKYDIQRWRTKNTASNEGFEVMLGSDGTGRARDGTGRNTRAGIRIWIRVWRALGLPEPRLLHRHWARRGSLSVSAGLAESWAGLFGGVGCGVGVSCVGPWLYGTPRVST